MRAKFAQDSAAVVQTRLIYEIAEQINLASNDARHAVRCALWLTVPLSPCCQFDLIDRDKSGVVNFKELLTGLSSAVSGTPQQKLDFYFNLYDMDGSGAIEQTEINRLLERGHETSQYMSGGSAAKVLEEYGLTSLDTDGDGHVSHEEFLRAVKENPGALELFGPVVH